MKKVLFFSILLILCSICSSVFADYNSYTITPSISELSIKLDETAIVEFEVAGDIPTGSSITARMDNTICDLAWGERRKSENGIVFSLQISGILLGESNLSVLLKGYEDIITTISVFVMNEPGTINFMGIPWDITPEQFDQELLNKGIDYTKSTTTSNTYFTFEGVPFKAPYPSDLDIRSQEFKFQSSKNEKYKDYPIIKVAGYNADYIYAEFKPSYSVAAKCVGKPYRLSRAKYQIWESDIPKEMTIYEAYDDLKTKLTKLYGEPTGSEKSGLYRIESTWWHAEDGTGVALMLYGSIGVYNIDIEYGVADESNYLNNINAIREWEKQQVVGPLSEDVDGL